MQSIDERRAALQQAMDLEGVSDDALDILAHHARVRAYEAGRAIGTIDAQSTELYIVVEGLVAVNSRSEHRRAPVAVVLGPGGVFGEDSLASTGIMNAVAYRDSVVLEIPAAEVVRVAAVDSSVAAVVERLVEIQRSAPWIVDQLRRCPLLRHVPPSGVYPLLEGARLRSFGPDQVVLEADQDPDSLVLVMAGEVELAPPGKVRVGNQWFEPRPVVLGPGQVFGDSALVRPGPMTYRVRAGSEGCRLLMLRCDVFRDEMGASPSFRRGVFSSAVFQPGDRTAMLEGHIVDDLLKGRGNWVAVVSDLRPTGLTTMVHWLARSSARQWEDRVLIVHLDPGQPEAPAAVRIERDPELPISEVRLHPGHKRFDPGLAQAMLHADTVYIDYGDLDPLAWPTWLGRVRRTVLVAHQAYSPIDPRILGQIVRPLVYTAVVPSPRPSPGEERLVPAGTVRIHRDLVDQARQGTPYEALAQPLRDQVDRWMRAVTERRVGVALGGGGALAYAHVALLAEMHRQGLPVDVVAGVSGGSVLGAFYVAGGQLGMGPSGALPDELAQVPQLALAIEQGSAVLGAADPMKTSISSGRVADYIDRMFDAVLLEDLLVPFYPVCTDIDAATQTTVRVGPIGFGVRASGSLPGAFTPTTFDRAEMQGRVRLPWERRPLPTVERGGPDRFRYVDGGVINNIPDDTCYLEGAQVVMASNVVPPPQPRSESSGMLFRAVQAQLQRKSNRLARFARELDPIVRLDDLLRMSIMMMHVPADWEARPAEGKFHPRSKGFFLSDWARAEQIWRQQEEGANRDYVVECVRHLRGRYEQLRWSRDEDLDTEVLIPKIQAALTTIGVT